jgi:hypothetical protein
LEPRDEDNRNFIHPNECFCVVQKKRRARLVRTFAIRHGHAGLVLMTSTKSSTLVPRAVNRQARCKLQ